MQSDSASPLTELLALMSRLRDKQNGCPWDIEQDFDSIAPHTIEEAYEVADAIARKDMDALKDELGDLLLQVVFHAQMAQENGAFTFNDIVRSINDKLIRRHPHIFADSSIKTAAEQTENWEAIKAQERADKKETGVLDGVSIGLPAMTRAYKLQKRAARVGFDWPDINDVFLKLEEESTELKDALTISHKAAEEEIGDLLFTCVNLARHADIEPESALRDANRKFERRFRYIEMTLATRGIALADVGLDEMERLWNEAKRNEIL